MSRVIREPLIVVGCTLLAAGAGARESTIAEGDRLVAEFQRVFAPSEPTLRDAASGPTKCATMLVREYGERRELLTSDEVASIDGYLAPLRAAGTLQYQTEHFLIRDELSGVNAVSSIDIAPANGVPDYVENIGAWAEISWDHHVDALGLSRPMPVGSRLEVAFREMNAYGYTDPLDGVGRIVLHRSFEGFP